MKKGFTLIEFIVTVAIIGILAIITLSALKKIRNEANCQETREECVSECYEREEKCMLKE